VEALADGFRRELAHEGIKVVLVEPGSYSTDIINEIPDTIKKLADETDGTAQALFSSLILA
jgi:NAD(P)-dependent dehydrogenase (short-subunit alcohol dehydrogenase family)